MFNNERFFVWGKQRRIPRYLHYKSIRLHKINISAIHLEQYIMLNSCTRFQSMYLQYTSHLQSTVYYDYAWFTKKIANPWRHTEKFPPFSSFSYIRFGIFPMQNLYKGNSNTLSEHQSSICTCYYLLFPHSNCAKKWEKLQK